MRFCIVLLLLASLVPRLYADTLVLRPTGAGTSTGLSFSGGTANYDCVDDAPSHDSDTTHVYNNTSDSALLDTYAIGNHSAETGTISSVVIRAYLAVESDPTKATYQLVVRTHSNNYSYPTSPATYTNPAYTAVTYSMTVNPNTGSAWTWTEIDDMEAGISLVRDRALKYIKCTQVEVEVTYTAVTNSAPSVTFDGFPALSSGTVTVNYNMIDADGDACDLTDYSTVAGVQYSQDNSNWYDATMGAGGDGLTDLTASASPGTDHKYAWASATDLPGIEDASVYLRMAPTDGQSTGTWATSNAFAVDNKAPVVATAIYMTAQPVSGDNSFQLDAAFSEINPNTNIYAYNLNNAGYLTGAGDAGVADPSAKTFSGITLNGDDKFTGIKCTHTDDMGNATSSENTAGIYVKPLVPQAPGLGNLLAESLDLTINANASEDGSDLYYVIRATYGVTTKYVQSDGTLGPDPVWLNDWAQPLTVHLSSVGSEVWLSVAAGNAQDSSPSAGENSASDYGPSAKWDQPAPELHKKFQFLGSRLNVQGVTIE
ncbi:MAG: hypothetical protein AB7V08_13470 [Elusimicrobiales bacterium]